jgi:hypothetical protein
LGSFMKKKTISPNLCTTNFQGKSYILILTKKGWATFWAIFQQTHLLTLVSEKVCVCV